MTIEGTLDDLLNAILEKGTGMTEQAAREVCDAVADVISRQPKPILADFYSTLADFLGSLVSRDALLTAHEWATVSKLKQISRSFHDQIPRELAEKYGVAQFGKCSCARCRGETKGETDIGKH